MIVIITEHQSANILRASFDAVAGQMTIDRQYAIGYYPLKTLFERFFLNDRK